MQVRRWQDSLIIRMKKGMQVSILFCCTSYPKRGSIPERYTKSPFLSILGNAETLGTTENTFIPNPLQSDLDVWPVAAKKGWNFSPIHQESCLPEQPKVSISQRQFTIRVFRDRNHSLLRTGCWYQMTIRLEYEPVTWELKDAITFYS